MAKTCAEYFQMMPASFQKSVAGDLKATYLFDLSGDGGGKWVVQVANGAASVGPGECEKPDVTLKAAAKDYIAIAEGKMNAMLAMATGKFKIQGSLPLAMKLEKIFKR